nr:uncharacterized protein LOC109180383 [Ipomoea batatas]
MADTRKASRRRASADDAAMVKAAAWAWYQHGSGSERPLGELLQLERTEKVQKPSRYKLEAIREVEEGKRKPAHHQRSSSTIPMSSSPSLSSLLDKYEIQRISLQLDRYIENGHDDYCYGVLGNTNDRRRVASLSESGTTKKPPPAPASFKGFWLRHAAVCGSSSADVVETGSIIGRSSRIRNMSSSAPLPAHNFSDRRKASRRRASADDAAMVKAAAWAWYQHGSGSERPLGELLRLERTEKVQKPSRYKLEAIREVEEGKRKPAHHQRSSSTIPMSSSPSLSSLLDKYEIQRISLQLDRYIENGHDDYCYGVLGNTNDRRRVASLSESGTTERKTTKAAPASFKGFWMRHAAVCGSSSADVVETGSIIGRSSRWPPRGKRIFPAVKTVGCGPRASCI